MDRAIPYAHSPLAKGGPWEPLREHVLNVAARATASAEAFAGAEWGKVLGLWHDLGKADPAWQAYLTGGGPWTEHKQAGARWARDKDPRQASRWQPLAMAILGHHGGLPAPAATRELLQTSRTETALGRLALPRELLDLPLPELPAFLTGLTSHPEEGRLALEMWTRMLFSCLVDADYIETERFYHPNRRAVLESRYEGVPVLRERLDSAVDELSAKASPGSVARARAEVLAACRAAAALEPGLFALTVPTGGGKTLAAMSFALRHAERHGLRRVIVVIPFTSIIEQNAGVYRDRLGAQNVLEHHSSLDPKREDELQRLACENWDAPIIVTTSVQFLESLHACKPSRCRKLHNVARSVIILDEVQSLPPELVRPTVNVLQELTRAYGCSVVLSTATQPALRARPTFLNGLKGVREIVPEPGRMFAALRRVAVEWPAEPEQPVPYADLAAELTSEERVLAVTHRRDDARILARLLPEEGLFHLSGQMCAAHRLNVLGRVREALAGAGPVRLVSTQLIEAGVDVDFPVVYRALAGLDSLVQAAGRCNREGKLARGRFVVYRAESEPPRGTPRRGLEQMISLLREYGQQLDLTDPDFCEKYFRLLYGPEPDDARGVLTHRRAFDFPATAEAYRLIEETGATAVVVPYGAADERLADLDRHGPSRQTLRSLQPFTVNLYDRDLATLRQAGALTEVADLVTTLTPPFRHLYCKHFGLIVEDPRPDPESLAI